MPLTYTFKSKLNTLWKDRSCGKRGGKVNRIKFWEYVISKIRAHGLQDRIDQRLREYFK
jgi:hypothetical protein